MGKDFRLASIPIIDYNYKVPYKELFTHLQTRQAEYDENAAKLDALENSWLTLQTVPGEEELGLAIQKGYDDKIDNVTNIVGGDLSKADGLIRDLSKGLKRDMTTGPFSKIQGNYTTYKALSDYLSEAVNNSDPKQRVERNRAEQWLNMSLYDFYSAGGSQGGATFSSKKPLTFVDINSKINKFLKGWKPDTMVGNILKQVDGSGNVSYVKQQGQYSSDGVWYTTDQYEIADPDEIRNAIMQHIESDPMASQYIEEGVMLNMQGLTPELFETEEGKAYLKTAREELVKLPQYNAEDVKNMNDMSVIANAMKYAEMQNMVEPFVDREGYEKHTQDITKTPEHFYKTLNNITGPDVNAAQVFESVTPLVKGDVNTPTQYHSVSDLVEHKESLEGMISAIDIQVEDYRNKLKEDPNDVTALQKIGELQQKRFLTQSMIDDINTNYADIFETVESEGGMTYLKKNRNWNPSDQENAYPNNLAVVGTISQDYAGEYADIITKWNNTHIGVDKAWKTPMEFFENLVLELESSSNMPKAYSNNKDKNMPIGDPDAPMHEKIKYAMDLMWLLNEYNGSSQIIGQASGNMAVVQSAMRASYWNDALADAFKALNEKSSGLWDYVGDKFTYSETEANFENREIFHYAQAWAGLQNDQYQAAKNKFQTMDQVDPSQLGYINFGTDAETGDMSQLSKNISRMYTSDPGSFVVYDINEGKILDYNANPSELQIDGVLLEPFGDGGHWLRAYAPMYNDKDEVIRDAQGTPKYQQSYLVSTNPYVGSGSSIFSMISENLSQSDDVSAIELSNRLMEQSFRNRLSQFNVLDPPPPGAPAQAVTIPIGDNDHIRVDRTTYGESATPEYRIFHESNGGYIQNNNGNDMVFYSLQEVTEAYRRLNEHIVGGSTINKNTHNTNQTTTIPRQQQSDFLEVPGAAAGVLNLSNKYGFKQDDVLSMIKTETAGTYSPAIQNSIGATGLIQFMPKTAKGLGTTTEALKAMSVEEQFKWIDKYFANALAGTPELEGYHPYLWVAAPGAANSRKYPYHYSVIWDENSIQSKQNPIWRVKAGDISNQNGAAVGSITRYSILASVGATP
jgi:hypothetical protein